MTKISLRTRKRCLAAWLAVGYVVWVVVGFHTWLMPSLGGWFWWQ